MWMKIISEWTAKGVNRPVSRRAVNARMMQCCYWRIQPEKVVQYTANNFELRLLNNQSTPGIKNDVPSEVRWSWMQNWTIMTKLWEITYRRRNGAQNILAMRKRAAFLKERASMAQLRFLLLGGEHNRLQELLVSAVSLTLVPHLAQLVLELSDRLARSKRTSSLGKSGALARDAFLSLWQAGVRTASSGEGGALLLHFCVGELKEVRGNDQTKKQFKDGRKMSTSLCDAPLAFALSVSTKRSSTHESRIR